MDLFAVCIPCCQTKNYPFLEQFSASYFDDQIARVKCDQGHDMAIIVRAPKFELLLESGANALKHNFTLEASASFSAALERFFEFCTNVILKHLSMPPSLYKTMFNTMSRQSERQLGSFFVLHALVFGTAYEPNQKITEFRNAIIHKGMIPSPEKSKKFCDLVYSEIYKVSGLLIDNCKKEIDIILNEEFSIRHSKIDKNVKVYKAERSSLFSISGDNNKPTFEEAYENFNSFNKTLKEASRGLSMFQLFLKDNPEIMNKINEIRPYE
ncbi:MAG: hypothetical protein ACRCV4_12005 [Hafnia alvei]